MATSTPTMYELSLFAGAGGGLLATQHLLGFRTICYVENAPYPIKVLKARIRDGLLDDAPIWDDVRTFRRDNPECGGFIERLAGLSDLLLTAGFPCQPWASGGKGLGDRDPRNMWPDTIRVISEVRPEWVFLENSPNLLQQSHKWRRPPYIQRIIAELAGLGYVGRWGCLSAAALGFDHKRRRVWVVAHAGGPGRKVLLRGDTRDGNANNENETFASVALESVWDRLSRLETRLGEPSVFGADDGLPDRVAQLAAAGEAQVPAVAASAWKLLTN